MRKRIIILGAGFGGLRAALLLGKEVSREHEVVLVDKKTHHTFTPLLYEVAATPKETASCSALHEVATYEIKDLLSGWPVNFITAEVTAIDITKNKVLLNNNASLEYDYLLLALGSETNFFNISGLKENSLEFKSFNDALRIRDRLWTLIQDKKKEIKIVVGGGGPTGVELSAELRNWLDGVEKDNQESKAEVTIVEALPTVLYGFPSKVIEKATNRLKYLGVKMITGSRITKVDRRAISLENGQTLNFDLLIWAGGVKANHLAQSLPFATGSKDRIIVSPQMNCVLPPSATQLPNRIYAVGDMVSVYDTQGKTEPMVARAAISQATVAAKNIIAELQGRKLRYAYQPTNYPYIIPLGGKYAIAKIGPLVISGFWSWLLKGLVELNYLKSIMPFKKALQIWLKGLKIFIENDRLG